MRTIRFDECDWCLCSSGLYGMSLSSIMAEISNTFRVVSCQLLASLSQTIAVCHFPFIRGNSDYYLLLLVKSLQPDNFHISAAHMLSSNLCRSIILLVLSFILSKMFFFLQWHQFAFKDTLFVNIK